MADGGGGGAPDVVIGICTFRREDQLLALLDALEGLTFDHIARPDLSIVVVDNAPEGGISSILADRAPTGGLTVVHLGASSISAARNEVLDRAAASGADLLALIDDDELPSPRWLEALLVVQRETGADMVVGPVLPRFPAGAPTWATGGDLYDLAAPPDRSRLDEGLTGNSLLRLSTVEALDLRFDEALGQAGGEDQVFFRTAVHRGADVRYAADAVVHETIPAARLTGRYILRREFRKGNTLGLLDRGAPGWPPPQPLRRLAKAVVWSSRGALVAIAGLLLGRRAQLLAGLGQVSRAVGMATGLGGRRFHAYRSAGPERPSVVFVATEDPSVQAAGHSQFLLGFLRHFDRSGFRVVLLVTEGRLGFVVRRSGTVQLGYEVRSPATSTLGRWTLARPRAAVRYLAWKAFLAAPSPAQRLVDVTRTRWRHRRAVDHVLGHPLDGHQSRWVNQAIAELEPEAVFFNTLFSVPTPLELPAQVKGDYVITVDVMSQRAEAFAALGYQVEPPGFGPRDEAAALQRVSGLVAIQWDDAAHLAALVPAAEVVVAPAAIDVPPILRRAPESGRCLFVGSGSLHNVDGIRWFLDECWPTVVARQPGAELHVVGTVCARLAAAPPGVVLRGPVDDLDGEYARAEVVVVPLRAGSGLKVKIVDALCHGAPVVTTAVGAQGLLNLDPLPFVVADEAAAMAHAVAALLGDPGRREALASTAAGIAPRFSPEQAYLELDASLRARGITLPADSGLPVADPSTR